MPYPILLKNTTVLSSKNGLIRLEKNPQDMRLDKGIITAIAKNLPPSGNETVFDLKGSIISPGFIDLHTHLRDFDQASSEDIGSGTKAAAAGGFTTVVAMANTQPPID